jgi:hypothetical protein
MPLRAETVRRLYLLRPHHTSTHDLGLDRDAPGLTFFEAFSSLIDLASLDTFTSYTRVQENRVRFNVGSVFLRVTLDVNRPSRGLAAL